MFRITIAVLLISTFLTTGCALFNNTDKPNTTQASGLENINSEDRHLRAKAAINLGESKDEKFLPVLAKKLEDNDRIVRFNSANAIASIGGTNSLKILLDSLKNEKNRSRAVVTSALGSFSTNKKATTALINLLSDDNLQVRRAAIMQLHDLTNPLIKKAIIETLSNEDDVSRGYAIKKLSSNKGDLEIQNALLVTLKDENSTIRAKGITALSIPEDPKAIKALLPLLSDESAKVRGNAVKALGQSKSKKVILPIGKLLNDDSVKVKTNAVIALGELKGNTSNDILIAIMKNLKNDHSLRGEAAIALGKIGDKKASPELLAALHAEPYWGEQMIVLDALGFLKDKETIKPLVEFLKSKNSVLFMRKKILKTLESIAGKTAENNLKSWQSWVEKN